MLIFGLDLSGPRNTAETVLICFNVENATLNFVALHEGASDLDIYEVTRDASTRDQVIIGMDAPLSYNPGGGDRPGDTELRTRIIEAGLHSGAVMPPTLTRMVYLTLRGVVIARSLRNIC